MMAGDARQPMHAKSGPPDGLDARAILEAVLPYAAALCFLLAVLVAALDERRCDGAAADPSTLAPLMSTAQPAPAADGECRPQAGVSGAPTE
ncbi:hypothetical protein LJR084_005597 [Variovorax sp. LjRoot84]|uniref:hypothetical protein n=1 Tax=Variovorax sp. LjRoot84 TaxID=3342340 RepID=UPI0008818CFF|nr:hypothetical protein SAMN05444679_121140 [Variovorax sp. CF079]